MFKLNLALFVLLSLPSLIRSQDSCTGSTATTNSNRKIAIVIDSSGSNADTDPQDLRIAAGKALAASLLPTDLVTVVDFDSSAAVISPLGPPGSASFDGINSYGGTYIASGVEAAIEECTKDPTSTTSGVTGIIVLTDGQDSYQTDLVEQLTKAKDLGIRVSFGFLSPSDVSATQDPSILSAILATGGVYSTIGDAAAQASFVNLVLSHGLVNSDTASGGADTLLLPGLATVGKASPSADKVFTYDAVAGEKLNFTVTALDAGGSFDVVLNAKSDATKSLGTGNTATAPVSILYSVPANGELDLTVSTKDDKTSGLFSVTVESSVKRTINLCGTNSTVSPSGTATGTSPPLSTGTGNVTIPQTPNPSGTAIFVGGAERLGGQAGKLLLLVGLVMMFV